MRAITPKVKPQLFILVFSLSAYLLIPFLLLWLFQPLSSGAYWEWLNGFGFVAFSLCLYLFVERARPKAWPRLRGDLFYWWHRLMAFTLLFFATAHGLSFLVLEPLSLEYFSLRAPWYMLAAWLAWFLFLYLCLASVRPFRQYLSAKGLVFRLSHGLLSIVALLASLYHIIGSEFYLKAFNLWAVSAVLVAVVLLYYGVNRLRQVISLSQYVLGSTPQARLPVSNRQKFFLVVYLVVLSSLLSGGLYVVTR